MVHTKILKSLHKYRGTYSLTFSFLALILSGYNFYLIKNTSSTVQVANTTTVDIKKFTGELKGDEPTLGESNAKVTVIEFADFQCPFCKKFFDESFPQLKEKYIDTGKVKFVLVNVAFLGQESKDAGQAAKCAGDQSKFWAYHDKLYVMQKGENQGNFSISNLKQFALDINLDTTLFNECMDEGKYVDTVDSEKNLANKYAVRGTPTFFIGESIIKGAVPFDVLEQTIKNKLK